MQARAPEKPSLFRCFTCGVGWQFIMVMSLILAIQTRDMWSYALVLLIVAGAAYALSRLCPAPSVDRLIQLDTAAGLLRIAKEDPGWRGWLCGCAWLTELTIELEEISGLRITPGYLAIYLKPHHMAIDVGFRDQDTADVRRKLALVQHLFVDEIPRL